MALHFYMNGTDGAQDGVEISNGDLSNPLVFDGFNAASGVTLSKTKTIHIRADAGEVWHDVIVTIVGNNSTAKDKFQININDNRYIWTYTIYTNSGTVYIPYYNTVENSNIPIIITAYINGSNTDSPNTNDRIVVVNGRKM